MSVELIVLVALAAFVVMLLIEVPIAFALAGSGALGIMLLRDSDAAVSTLAAVSYDSTSLFSLVVIPMFILLGSFALYGKIVGDLFEASDRLFGRLPGGIGVATVATCAGFGAVTGSSLATAATIGRLAIGEMMKRGVPGSLATGIVAAAGTLGALIPPSVLLVFLAVLAEQSVGRMLLAGILPGLLSAANYMLAIAWRQRKVSLNHPESPVGQHRRPYAALLKIAVLFTVVVGGIYSGVFTPTESGALGAIVALFIMAGTLRRSGLRAIWSGISNGLREATAITSMTFAILVGAGVFSTFLVWARVPSRLTAWAIELPISPLALVVILLLLLIPLGMMLDGFSIVVITVPLMFPIVLGLGFDGLWFGILMVKMIELGLITPPVGINVFVAAGSSPGVTAEEGFKGVAPFAAVDLLTVGVLLIFPGIVTFLPDLVGV